MKAKITLLFALAAMALMPAMAQDRPDHFHGKSPETLSQALEYFSEYNAKVAELLAKEELDIHDLVAIHELTYTLENSLEKNRSELAELADMLEDLHVATETADYEGARTHGRAYLEKARILRD